MQNISRNRFSYSAFLIYIIQLVLAELTVYYVNLVSGMCVTHVVCNAQGFLAVCVLAEGFVIL